MYNSKACYISWYALLSHIMCHTPCKHHTRKHSRV